MSKPSPDWKQERDGSVVMDGQVVIDIRDCGPDEAPIETKRANAKLIAAAPKLLEACINFAHGRKESRECEGEMLEVIRLAGGAS